ncbi:LytR C-terminal domain-containing protein [Glaciimonas sp. PCH181]|uniref:LytR C-terminal domain-containing protein n=1 Tax=Glaciimonas sp. PCH181 TaxID=2133943 RepID=UPI000D3628FB|nr:LytR C-terminal domain-containing protein [Glaciimonas sp. PCH181]PUA17743.1 hypothetical protein C7W93_17930 [Glaciimonas sp. PCH181]
MKQTVQKAMQRTCLLLPLVCSTPVLLGCSSLTGTHATPAPNMQTMRMDPLLRIRNSDSGARGFYQLGRYLQGQNRLQAAEDAYRQALAALNADYIDAQNALGTIYSAQGKFDEAIAAFNAILAKNPQLAHVQNNLGYAFYLQGNYAGAVAAFNQALVLEPNNLRTRNNLAKAQQKMGEPEPSQFASGNILSKLVTVNTLTSVKNNSTLPALTSGKSIDLEAPTQLPSVTLNTSRNPVQPKEAQQSPPQSSQQNKGFNFEVTNANGIPDLARKVAETMVQNGLPTARLSNLKPFQQNRTIVRYRDGFYYDAARVGLKLPAAPLLVLDTQMRKETDVQLVLGKDATPRLALLTTAKILAAAIPQLF